MPENNQFYPITDNGTKIMMGFDDAGEFLTYTTSLENFDRNEKIFCSIDARQTPSVASKTAHITTNQAPLSAPAAFESTPKPKGKKKTPSAAPFSGAENVKLIREVELRPETWNFSLPLEARESNIVKAKWNEIGEKFPDRSVDNLQEHWRNLQTARKKRIGENKKKMHSGAKREEIHDYVYEANMAFLNTIDLGSRKTSSNINFLNSINNDATTGADNVGSGDQEDTSANSCKNYFQYKYIVINLRLL